MSIDTSTSLSLSGIYVTNVMAASLDGAIAAHPDERDSARLASGFTHPDDQAHLLELLRGADAVIVGARSLIASLSAFEVVNDRGLQPLWAILSNRGLPPELPFWRQAQVRRWIVSQAPLRLPPHEGRVENIVAESGCSIPFFTLQALKRLGLNRILLFGGSEVNRQFYAEHLVDSLWLTICPLILASKQALPLVQPDLPEAVWFRLASSQARGDLVFLNYQVQKQF